MGLHYSFEYLQHKFWLKEGMGVKVSILLITIKSWESPWITCVQVACHISLERSRQGCNFSLNLVSIGGLQKKLGLQMTRVPTSGILWQLRSPRQSDISMQPSWPIKKNTTRGKVVVSPKSGPWWVLWAQICSSFICASKVLQICTNQLVVWFAQINMNN
jgi:hypothetical protein